MPSFHGFYKMKPESRIMYAMENIPILGGVASAVNQRHRANEYRKRFNLRSPTINMGKTYGYGVRSTLSNAGMMYGIYGRQYRPTKSYKTDRNRGYQ